MSSRVVEECPLCGMPTMPTDRVVAIEGKYGTYPVKLWRYECEMCDWVWANLAQREHNAEAERRARRDMKQRALLDL